MRLDELNERHGTQFRAVGDYEGGEFGAQRLLDESGTAYVLKLQPPGLGPATTEALRTVGYPAPRYVFAGPDYSVQEELTGEPLGGWRVPLHPRLLELNELQMGLALDDDRSWPKAVVDSILVGGEDYMILATLLDHSPEGRELVELCQVAAGRNAEVIATVDDVVH